MGMIAAVSFNCHVRIKGPRDDDEGQPGERRLRYCVASFVHAFVRSFIYSFID